MMLLANSWPNSPFRLLFLFFTMVTIRQTAADVKLMNEVDHCELFDTEDNVYFYGKVFKREFNVAAVEQCALTCWKAKQMLNISYLSASYRSTFEECMCYEDMRTDFQAAKTVKRTDYVYICNISCTGDPLPTLAPSALFPKSSSRCHSGNCGDQRSGGQSCGVANPRSRMTSRIVGGLESNKNGWPWLVSVEKQDAAQNFVPDCGGSVIRLDDSLDKTDVIITAEHCLKPDGKPFNDVTIHRVIAGEFDSYQVDGTEEIKSCKSFHSPGGTPYREHSYYDTAIIYAELRDIAIIILNAELTFQAGIIDPVCLPVDGNQDPAVGDNCVVTGWGALAYEGSYPDKPHEVIVPITDKPAHKCGSDKADICAGYDIGLKDACTGDSGGPLNCKLPGSNKWALSGVVSRGTECALPNEPGIYAKVTYNLDWIWDTICEHSMFANQITTCRQRLSTTSTSSTTESTSSSITGSTSTSSTTETASSSESSTVPSTSTSSSEPTTSPSTSVSSTTESSTASTVFPSTSESSPSSTSASTESTSSGSTKQPYLDPCGDWSDWGECSSACNGGIRNRTRVLNRQCIGCAPEIIFQPCNQHLCPIDCILSEWGCWGGCSVSCGDGGVRERRRYILQHPMNGADPCPHDDLVQCTPCPHNQSCPIDCLVSEWSEWGECSVSCGVGVRHRERKELQSPLYGGTHCPYMWQQQPCNTGICPAQNCSVSPWTLWSGSSDSGGGSSSSGFSEVLIFRRRYVQRNLGEQCPVLFQAKYPSSGN